MEQVFCESWETPVGCVVEITVEFDDAVYKVTLCAGATCRTLGILDLVFGSEVQL